MNQHLYDVSIDGTLVAKVIQKEGGTRLQYLLADGTDTTDVLRNSSLAGFDKLSESDLITIGDKIREYYKRVTEDGGEINSYLSIDDFVEEGKKSGIIIEDILEDSDGLIEEIKLRFLKVEDIPLIPTNKIIGYNTWETLEW
jgi:hypothetical protein